MRDHPLAAPRRPVGQVTRGKTAPNRLRRVDAFVLAYDEPLLHRQAGDFRAAPWVDLGFGFEPRTTLDSHRLWRRVAPELSVIGVEIDPRRVEHARQYLRPGVDFRLGGFDLPLGPSHDALPTKARLVRAFNVLRQYEPEAVAPAYVRLARHVLAGGLLVEGTSDPLGRVWVSHVLRRTEADWATTVARPVTRPLARPRAERASTDRPRSEPRAIETLWRRECLVFGTNFRGLAGELDPAPFQAVLPKDLIHRVVPGEPIYDLIEAWRAALRETRATAAFGRRRHFVAAGHVLADRLHPGQPFAVDPRRRWLRRGWLVVRFPPALTNP